MNTLDLNVWCDYLIKTYAGTSDIEIDIRNLARISIAMCRDRNDARMALIEYVGLDRAKEWTDSKPEIEKGGTF